MATTHPESTIKGPQLTFNKTYLFMNAEQNKINYDTVVVKNQGTTTVTYEWKKVHRGDHVQSKKSDFIQRFFCHYPRSILKPGESKTFTFSFKSEKIGMFNEEWELLTEPLLLTSLPPICLAGIATQEDMYEVRRGTFWQNYENEFQKREVPQENIDAWFNDIKNPKVVMPDLNDPMVFKQLFEDVNRHLNLFYTKETMENFNDIYDDICMLRKRQDLPVQSWDCRVEMIEKSIGEIMNPMTRQTLLDRYVKLLNKAKKTPNDRALSFSVINNLSRTFVENIVDHEAKFRTQLEIPPNEFPWQPIPEATDMKAHGDFLKAEYLKRQELLKKLKKKPKTEDEEANDIKELINRSTQSMSTQMTDVEIDKMEFEIELLKTEWLMENNLNMDEKMFEKLNRKVSVLDVDISEQEIILRTDLDVPLSPYVPFKPIEEEFKDLLEQLAEAENDANNNTKTKKAKKTKKQLDEEAEQLAKYEEAKRIRAEPWKVRQILDHKLLKRAEVSIKYLQEKLVKRVIVLSSIGEKCGRTELQNSVRVLQTQLQNLVSEVPLVYLDEKAIENFSSVEEGLKEGNVYLAENLNFRPDEHSFVKPWVDPNEKEKKKEEKKTEEPVAVVDVKKMNAADKKKYEEELKRREEELAKSQPTEAEMAKEAAIRHKKELEAQKRKETEYFDFKTTYSYIQNLRSMGSVYVNDAPLACLTSSNSVAEMKCKLNVMGIKLTEDLRKLAKFFMKRFPLSVHERHFVRPSSQPYFKTQFTVVIGGLCKNHTEMLDKILLVNQLIEQATKIFFVGDIGIAAVACLLDTRVSKVDHNNLKFLDYSRFFKRLMHKAMEKGCDIILPVDFQVARKITKEEIQEQEQKNKMLSSTALEEVKQSMEDKSKLKGAPSGKKDAKEVIQSPPADKAHTQTENTWSEAKCAQIWSANPNFHWTDVVIQADKDYIVDVEEQIAVKLDALLEHKRLQSPAASRSGLSNTNAQSKMSVGQESKSQSQLIETQLNPEDHFLQYGPRTAQALCEAVFTSFRIFWDGSISLYQDTAKSSTNNKDFLNALLEVRTSSDQQQEPPVTLIHGHESESTLRKTLLRIKIDQQEALEALRAKQAAEAGESEQEQDVNLSESKAEISTFQEDMETICDFLVSDCTPFTTKLLQGAHIKALYAFDEHRKPTAAENDEALQLLDEI